ITQLDRGTAFDAHQFARYPGKTLMTNERSGAFAVLFSIQESETLAVVAGEVFVDGIELVFIVFAHLFEVGDCGFENLAARGFFLEVSAWSAGQAERAHQGRQRQSLQHESGENHREGEKDNEIPLWKRRAIGEGLRQSDGGGKGDDAAHAGPAND